MITKASVTHLLSDSKGRVYAAEYMSPQSSTPKKVYANIFVVACQAIETARLLLNSKGPKFPNGLSNNTGNVGKNLLFAGGGSGSGKLDTKKFKSPHLQDVGTFINRHLADWYLY